MINVNKEGIKSQLLEDLEGELSPLVSRMKKAGITKEDVNEVIDKLWKE
jgi:DNA-binding transcriptional regulator YhcF (GntR family)